MQVLSGIREQSLASVGGNANYFHGFKKAAIEIFRLPGIVISVSWTGEAPGVTHEEFQNKLETDYSMSEKVIGDFWKRILLTSKEGKMIINRCLHLKNTIVRLKIMVESEAAVISS